VSPPYAAPLLAVDDLQMSTVDGRLVVIARKEVRVSDPYQAAHFPDRTVYPGVFIVETVRQAVLTALGERDGVLPDLSAVHSLRFLGGMHPGEQLCVTATVEPPDAAGAIRVDVRCRRADEVTVARLALEFRYEGGLQVRAPGPSVGADPTREAQMYDFGQVREILPQGTPMVLVDRVDWLDPGVALRATKTVSGSEPCYVDLPAGLPRQRYAYPFSLLVESFGQAAAVLWLSKDGGLAAPDDVLMFAAARDLRFHGRAYPGDVLRHEVRLESSVARTGFATGETWIGDRLIATMGSFVAVVRAVVSLPAVYAPVSHT
jgi:3-hydroxymyristoyl/3-hydroxydecanoyl-(acyl carrier protein) dehydratase